MSSAHGYMGVTAYSYNRHFDRKLLIEPKNYKTFTLLNEVWYNTKKNDIVCFCVFSKIHLTF